MPANWPYSQFRIKTLLKKYDYLFSRKTVKIMINHCYVFFFWSVFTNVLSRLNKENLLLLISYSASAKVMATKVEQEWHNPGMLGIAKSQEGWNLSNLFL